MRLIGSHLTRQRIPSNVAANAIGNLNRFLMKRVFKDSRSGQSFVYNTRQGLYLDYVRELRNGSCVCVCTITYKRNIGKGSLIRWFMVPKTQAKHNS